MRLVFGLLYTIFLFSLIATALFIAFHLLRYSLNRKMASWTTIFFLVIFTILLVTNAGLFFSLPFESLLPSFSL